MNTHELEGAALDYWVAKALGLTCRLMKAGERLANVALSEDTCVTLTEGSKDWYQPYHPSSVWFFGGSIIEEHHIEILYFGQDGISLNGAPWEAQLGTDTHYIDQGPGDAVAGATPLIAAMRALVQSKLGDEVPDTFQ